MKDNRPLMTILLMGGDMQAQGHVQALVDVLDLGANLQLASDMARFHHSQVANNLQMETELYKLVGRDLRAMGHNVQSTGSGIMGGFQSIMFVPRPELAGSPGSPGGYYRAGSDHRKDGEAVGW
jgi:gamma-glutamyltranspeptidase / glutathione hydrolase